MPSGSTRHTTLAVPVLADDDLPVQRHLRHRRGRRREHEQAEQRPLRRRAAESQLELPSRHDDGAAGHLDTLDRVGRTPGRREERRRPPDLGALGDLDLLAGADEPVAQEMDGERTGRRSGGRIFRRHRRPGRTSASSSGVPEPAQQFVPTTPGSLARRLKSGSTAATSSSDPSTTNAICSPLS